MFSKSHHLRIFDSYSAGGVKDCVLGRADKVIGNRRGPRRRGSTQKSGLFMPGRALQLASDPKVRDMGGRLP